MRKLPNRLVEKYAFGFFGYGSWKAKIWFVGMEEGGSKHVKDVAVRLKAWSDQGGRLLADCKRIHSARGETRWHEAGKNGIQRTWKNLIRMYLLAHGKNDDPKDILEFQHNGFGKKRGPICSVELFPLPSPNVATWKYDKWSDLPWLKSRREYKAEVVSKRIALIKHKINRYRPPIVIFYGYSLLTHWNEIAQTKLKKNKIAGRKLWEGTRDGVSFYATPHPARVSTRYYTQVGKLLKRRHQKDLR